MDDLPRNKTTGDFARDVGRAIISAIPSLGGPLQVVFESVFAAPLDRRKEAWLQELAGVVDELGRRLEDFSPERLGSNEAFVTVAMQASQIAVRNHQAAKLQALRNAVLNSALPGAPVEDEQLIFVRLIDQLAPWHLRVLAFLDEPVQWMQREGMNPPSWSAGAVSTLLEQCLPELRGYRDTYEQIVRELQAEGLLGQGNFLPVMLTGSGVLESRTTQRGKRFIRFISNP
jgi:hypothetical protein